MEHQTFADVPDEVIGSRDTFIISLYQHSQVMNRSGVHLEGDEGHQEKEIKNPLFAVDSDVSTRVEDTALWAQDLFQLKGATGSKEITAKTARLGYLSVYLLFCLGVAAGLINGLILMANAALCKLQANVLVVGGSYGIGFLYFLVAMTISVFFASICCKYGSSECAGSGLPQFKYILASEMTRASYDKLLSFNIFILKVIGLILSVGGGLSVGSEGPLVLIAACIAHLIMKHIVYFDDILDNSSLTKQIFAASAAVGLGSAFNSPVGGLLFSIEVTSTFYLVSNYWKSFLAAMAGSVACSLFLITKDGGNGDPLLVVEMLTIPKLQYLKWELAIFALMGISFGYFANAYLQLHQKVHELMRPFNRTYPLACAVTVAFITAFLIYITGSYTKDSVGVIALVSDVFNQGQVTEMSSSGLHPMSGLIIMLIVRVILTLLGTNILVPAGIFMPVILMGGVLGRFVGYFIYYCGHKDVFIAGYALVGAVAFSSGITHTISAAVIAVEMTGDIGMLLPCLIVAVLSAGITKSSGLSVYDQGMINKGLETFQLLLLGKYGRDRVAASVMDDKVGSLPKTVRILQLIKALELTDQTVFPVIDDHPDKNMQLVGSVLRRDIYAYLKKLFEVNGLDSAITLLLKVDSIDYERRLARRLKREAQRRRDNHIINTLTTSIERTVGHVTQSLDVSDLFLFKSVPGKETEIETKSETEVRIEPEKGRRRRVSFAPDVDNSHSNSSPKSADAKDNFYLVEERNPMHVYSGIIINRNDSKDDKSTTVGHTAAEENAREVKHENPISMTREEEGHLTPTANVGIPMSASSVWASVNTAAQSFMRGTMDALQYQESPEMLNSSGEGSLIKKEKDNTTLLAVFALEVHMESEPQLHLNLFPFRYLSF